MEIDIRSLKDMNTKVDSLEKDLQSMKTQMSHEMKKTHEKIVNLQNQSRRQAEEIAHLRDQKLLDQTRSMRSNLIFRGIPERDQQENSESLVREFIEKKMNIDTRELEIERAHRIGRIARLL